MGRATMQHNIGPSPPAAGPAAQKVGLPEAAGMDAGLLHVLESSSEALAVIDTEGRCLYVNARAAQSLGQDRQGMLGRCFWDAFAGAIREPLKNHCGQAIARQAPLHFDGAQPGHGPNLCFNIHPSRTGLTVYWRPAQHASAIASLDPAGQEPTETRTEQTLRESEARLAAALEGGRMGLWEWEMRANRSVWNATEYQLLGLPVGEGSVPTHLFFDRVHPEDAGPFNEILADLMKNGSEFYHELRIIRADDRQERWLAAAGRLSRDAAGQPLKMIGVNYDITERKRAEAELIAAKLIAERAKAAAEEASKAKDQFLAVLSHELRMPLTPVLAVAGILESDWRLPDEVRDDMRMIRRNVETQARLIDDLLDLTRITHGKLELRLQPVEIGSLLQQTIETCAADARARNQTLTLDEGAESRRVQADPSRLQQVFWNLLKNAIKFTGEGGHIAIRCLGDAQGRVVVEVADNGQGIAPDVLPRLFNAFEQGSRLVTRRHGGLGLGLSICKAMVELHQGAISAHSPGPGRGTTFRVVLPALAAPRSPIRPDAPMAAAVISSETELRILLVDDHADTARMLGRLLQAFGHRVATAGTVRGALALAEQQEFDLLISDLGLPDGSGLDLVRSIRSIRPDLKSIALSGYGGEQDICRSKEAGFLEHLIKPVDLKHLQAVISRLTP